MTAVIDNDVTSKGPSTSILRPATGRLGELAEKMIILTKASIERSPTILNPELSAREYAAF